MLKTRKGDTFSEIGTEQYNSGCMEDPKDERELYERIRAGDKAACNECIERHAPEVYRLALRLLNDEAEAEDVMQETFLNAFRAVDEFEWRSGMKTWLYRIAYNATLMRLRRKQPVTVSVDAPEFEAEVTDEAQELLDWCCVPERDFETAEARAELQAALEALPEKLRAVFVLRELEGLSTEATAEALNISLENVKTRLYRARLWLRERLAPYFTEMRRN